MTIIQLNEYRRAGVRAPSGIYFPTLYRLTGYNWKLRPGTTYDDSFDESDLLPDTTSPIVQYSLDGNLDCRFANEERVAITHLDPRLDRGVVFIRHWSNKSDACAYMDGLDDALAQPSGIAPILYQIDQSLFTLFFRPASDTQRDCVLVYYEDSLHGWPIGDPWCHTVLADGSTSSDHDMLGGLDEN
jgi:hypothetical protein